MGPKCNRFDPRLASKKLLPIETLARRRGWLQRRPLLNLDATPEDDVVDGLTRRAMAKMRARHD
jgi:hypothetical protein